MPRLTVNPSPMRAMQKFKKLGRTMIALCLVLSLTMCASSPPPLPMPSLPPIVHCGENLPSEPLAAYPQLHQRLAGESDSQYIADLERDRSAAAQWAVSAAGVAQRNAILRNTTQQCLARLRAAHIIQ